MPELDNNKLVSSNTFIRSEHISLHYSPTILAFLEGISSTALLGRMVCWGALVRWLTPPANVGAVLRAF